ncbi:DUF397 domain-containing protein [Streptomyces sp. NPDC050610]|uniref:DUF397 domain-containing protein n=1 Tax=Streptomyces sp. NPDC050610 TaxID=3157097 RepID=UPI00343D2FDB
MSAKTPAPHWFKSSYSDNGGTCVEIAANLADTHRVVPVRDSTDPYGPILSFNPDAWASFVAFARAAEV